MAEQRETTAEIPHDELGFERIVFFSDAVMAIAITLMALEIRLPELEPDMVSAQVGAALLGLAPHIFVYILSFMVIGMYWLLHHRLFRMIVRYNSGMIWFNLIFLMFAAFVPVATNALGTYPEQPLVIIMYAVSLALMGFSELALWLYAWSRHMIKPAITRNVCLYIALRMLVPPMIFLLSIPVALTYTQFAELSWALMIPVVFVLRFLFPREHAMRMTFESGHG